MMGNNFVNSQEKATKGNTKQSSPVRSAKKLEGKSPGKSKTGMHETPKTDSTQNSSVIHKNKASGISPYLAAKRSEGKK